MAIVAYSVFMVLIARKAAADMSLITYAISGKQSRPLSLS